MVDGEITELCRKGNWNRIERSYGLTSWQLDPRFFWTKKMRSCNQRQILGTNIELGF